MTIALARLSEMQGAANREAFLRTFITCAPRLREPEWAPYAPSIPYTELVLTLMRQVPHELMLIRSGGEVVGRSAVCALRGTVGAAGIGLFESAPGSGRDVVSGALVDASCRWAHASALTEVFAPIDMNSWFSYRFLLPPPAGEALGPFYHWEPVQPLEHPRAFLDRGFTEAERYRTIVADVDAGEVRAMMGSPAVDRAIAAGYVFERLVDPAGLSALLDEAYDICMEAFAGTLLFEPIDLTLFRTILMAGAATRDCTLTHWVRDADRRMVGFVLAFVDDGATVIKTVATARAARGKHLSTALIQLASTVGAERGLRRVISALVRSGNTSERLATPYVAASDTIHVHEYALLRRESAL
ncbi:MAG: hypothetical protein NVS1B4_23520 [Gemmatimonadaceae bacterium]